MKPSETQLPAVANDNAKRVDRRYRYAWRSPGGDSDLVVSYQRRQQRCRSEAARMGWRLERSKARSECTAGHGLYRIVDATSGAYVAGGEPYPFSLLLKDAEALLLGAHHPRQPKGGRG
jgi:hypothetical protein